MAGYGRLWQVIIYESVSHCICTHCIICHLAATHKHTQGLGEDTIYVAAFINKPGMRWNQVQ